MASKRTEIKRLVRSDYGFPILQELLAELVYETRNYNKKDLDGRYNDLLKILLGTPKLKKKVDGYKDDALMLSRVAMMVKFHGLTTRKAALEVARLRFIKGYKFKGTPPINIDENLKAQISALQTRLFRKVDGKVDIYAKQFHELVMTQERMLETEHEEIDYSRSLFADWSKRYLGQ